MQLNPKNLKMSWKYIYNIYSALVYVRLVPKPSDHKDGSRQIGPSSFFGGKLGPGKIWPRQLGLRQIGPLEYLGLAHWAKANWAQANWALAN